MSVRVLIESGSLEARFSVICILWGLNREAQKGNFLDIFHSEKFCFDFYVKGLQDFAGQKRTAPFWILSSQIMSSDIIGLKYRGCQTHCYWIQVTMYKYRFDWQPSRPGMSDHALTWHVRYHIRQYNLGNFRNLHNLLLRLQWAFHVQEIIFRTEFFGKNGKVTKKNFLLRLSIFKAKSRKNAKSREIYCYFCSNANWQKAFPIL